MPHPTRRGDSSQVLKLVGAPERDTQRHRGGKETDACARHNYFKKEKKGRKKEREREIVSLFCRTGADTDKEPRPSKTGLFTQRPFIY